MTNWLSWLKSALFTGQGFAPAEKFGIDLGEFFQALPKLLIGHHRLLAIVALGWGFEQELQNVAQRDGISVEELKKSPDFDPYFNLKVVLVEEGGQLKVGYFEFLPPSIMD